ncbi:glycosyltransferase family 4 protein [Sphaerospermopsis aphanizomenoides BCCUSP55]|uniref:glycosyltransferase family 4 protein n=1 Tax=Sphaerospermopsis aphanizomenoides TaxID=459663 RepID=UPI0019083EB8|nr:glycosyltransferase family 4 protein [Sphaerospermopsis aphanizomenoides]MBK1988969.1 glycosyltransferase family 4 protein [Sphaerospermopsis aphanizomenoides BCCUSP55]
MKSYLLVTGDFVKTGGMDRANFALAEYLAKQGEQVHLVAHRVASELLAYSNVIFHQVPKIANSYLLSSPLLAQTGRIWAKKISYEGGRVLVNGGNCQWPDVNWVHYVHAAYEPDQQAGLLRQLKGRISRHVFLSEERKALQAARVIIVNSNRTKQDLIDKLAISEQKLFTVYHGTDTQVFYPPTPEEKLLLRQQLGWTEDQPVLIFMGALGDRRKGFDTLFAAWQQLCKSHDWDVILVVIGTGAELPLWQHRASEVGISANINFLGFRNDVPKLLQAADCLVAPTRYEAYGLGVHEALCCGLPALVSADAGIAEHYPKELQDLLIGNCEDINELVEKLKKWRSHQYHYNNLVSCLSQKLRNYTWDDMAKNILAIFHQDVKL